MPIEKRTRQKINKLLLCNQNRIEDKSEEIRTTANDDDDDDDDKTRQTKRRI